MAAPSTLPQPRSCGFPSRPSAGVATSSERDTRLQVNTGQSWGQEAEQEALHKVCREMQLEDIYYGRKISEVMPSILFLHSIHFP